MSPTTPRILRIGVVHDGRIVEERLVRKREQITLGQSPRSTLYLPFPELPKRRVLFDVRRGVWRLRLDTRRGRLKSGGELVDLSTLPRAVDALPLDDDARGKIELGAVTVLFQMVPAPPPKSRVVLPVSARGTLGQRLASEAPVVGTVVASLMAHIAFVALSIAFETPPDTVKKAPFLTRAFDVDVTIKPDEPELPPEPTVVEATEDAPIDEPESGPTAPVAQVAEVTKPVVPKATKPTPPKRARPKTVVDAGDKPKTPKMRKAHIRDTTIIKHITSAGKDGIAGPDTLAKGHHDMETAFLPKRGVRVADSADDQAGFRGGPRASGDGQEPHVASRSKGPNERLKTDKTRKAPQKNENRVRIGTRVQRPTGTAPRRNLVKIHRFFRSRGTAFRSCYETHLRTVPGLAGKVTLLVSISDSGRIGAVQVVGNTTGSSGVAQCITRKVRRWKIDEVAGFGQTRVKLPIVLNKSSAQ